MTSEDAFLLDSELVYYTRSLSRGVRRSHKHAHLLQRWYRAQNESNNFEAAAIFAELASQVPRGPRVRVPFNFNALSNDDCKRHFRFWKTELCILVEILELRDVITRERTRASAMEALCVMLYKLSVPVRWYDVEDFFGRSASGLSNIFLHMLKLLDDKYSTLLQLNISVAAPRLATYADAIFSAGSLYPNIWCFIDGTVRGICRPTPRRRFRKRKLLSQQSVYNGHKRKHALKFQTLVTPDGMISHLFGPFPGRNHDIKMYRESHLADIIRADELFKNFRIFGDCAYGRDDVMLSPFEGALGNLTKDQLLINGSMSKIRVSVEWSYAQIVNYWKALDVKSSLRVGSQPVGLMYRVGVLMTNCITCLRGGNTASNYFGVKPPCITEYLLPQPS